MSQQIIFSLFVSVGDLRGQLSMRALDPSCEKPNDDGRSLAFAALLVAFLGVLLSGGCLQYSWPPHPDPFRQVVELIGLSATVVAFMASRRRAGWATRLVAGVGALSGLAVVGIAIQSHFKEYHDYSLLMLVPAVTVTAVGCLLSRQYVVLGAVAGALTIWFGGTFAAPRSELPDAVTKDGVTLRLVSVNDYGCEFELEAPNSDGFTPSLDFHQMRCEASSGPYLDVTCWSPHDLTYEEGPVRKRPYSARIFSQPWMRSLNLRISVEDTPGHVVEFSFIRLPVSRALGKSES